MGAVPVHITCTLNLGFASAVSINMAARARRGSGSTASTKENGKDDLLERKIELIREATGAAEEDIRVMLAECNNESMRLPAGSSIVRLSLHRLSAPALLSASFTS